MPHSPRRWTNNVLSGVRTGLYWGLGYASWALGLFVFRGSAPFTGIGVTAPTAVAFYLAAGMMAGGVVGLLKPFASTLVGKMVIGFVAALAPSFLMFMTLLPLVDWGTKLVVLSLIFAGIMGPLFAAAWDVKSL